MILPVVFPPITADSQYADMLTTVLPYKGGYEWYFSNFIQIYSDFSNYKYYRKGELRFREQTFAINKDRPVFWYNCIPFVKTINTIDDITCFIDINTIVRHFKSLIDNGNYIIAYIDRHLINPYFDLGSLHSVLIYGYDTSAFKIADYVCHSGRYVFSELSFENTCKSFGSHYKLPPYIDSDKKIVFFKMGDSDYKLDSQLIKRLLNDYYHEINTTDSYECLATFNKYEHSPSWGMGCITYLIGCLESLENESIDVKQIYLIFDHKKAMVERIEYLLSVGLLTDGSLLNEYCAIKNRMTACVLYGLRYRHSGDRNFISKIISQLKFTYDMEKDLLPKILANLNG